MPRVSGARGYGPFNARDFTRHSNHARRELAPGMSPRPAIRRDSASHDVHSRDLRSLDRASANARQRHPLRVLLERIQRILRGELEDLHLRWVSVRCSDSDQYTGSVLAEPAEDLILVVNEQVFLSWRRPQHDADRDRHLPSLCERSQRAARAVDHLPGLILRLLRPIPLSMQLCAVPLVAHRCCIPYGVPWRVGWLRRERRMATAQSPASLAPGPRRLPFEKSEQLTRSGPGTDGALKSHPLTGRGGTRPTRVAEPAAGRGWERSSFLWRRWLSMACAPRDGLVRKWGH
jgi:hypothetical protein